MTQARRGKVLNLEGEGGHRHEPVIDLEAARLGVQLLIMRKDEHGQITLHEGVICSSCNQVIPETAT